MAWLKRQENRLLRHWQQNMRSFLGTTDDFADELQKLPSEKRDGLAVALSSVSPALSRLHSLGMIDRVRDGHRWAYALNEKGERYDCDVPLPVREIEIENKRKREAEKAAHAKPQPVVARPPVMAAAKPQQQTALPLQRQSATIRLLGRWDVTLTEARALYEELRGFFAQP